MTESISMKYNLCPCSFHNPLAKHCFCHIEVIETAAKPPKNIRIGCEFHHVWLKECFETVEEACAAWNRSQGVPKEES